MSLHLFSLPKATTVLYIFMRMASSVSTLVLISFIIYFKYNSPFVSGASSSSCPIDLSYVQTIPWDTSLCRANSNVTLCCQTLLTVYGMGLAQHLRDTSMFQLPNSSVSASCLSDLQTRVAALSIDPSVVPSCFNSTRFVSNTSDCLGITTVEEWNRKLGPMTRLDDACQGNLTLLPQCSSCIDVGLKVISELTTLDPSKSSKCFEYATIYTAGVANRNGPLDVGTAVCVLELPIASSSSYSKRSSSGIHLLVLVVISVSFGLVLLASALTIFYRRYRKRKIIRNEAAHEEYVNNFMENTLQNSCSRWFHLTELEAATDGFSPNNFIGQGSHGVVHKGILPDGTSIAVKQITDMSSYSVRDQEFVNEVEIISKIKHRNLLSLRGCCVTSNDYQGRRRFLVYDFMPNGSLSDHLFIEANRKQLTWPLRKSIILDVAKGLAYLHHGVKPAIYHRDIKATNILLNQEMQAKIADFGLAKENPEGHSHLTTRAAGTHGYLAPEYALYGQLTDKTDVYSFGILVLEIMSGRKALHVTESDVHLIADWASSLAKLGKVEQVFDEWMWEQDQGPKRVMERFVHVGILCAHVSVAFRPSMADALRMLEGDLGIPKLPDRPSPLGPESFRTGLDV